MELYKSYNNYLKQKYGGKTWRLPLARNEECPNRLFGRNGCSFCDGSSFLPDYLTPGDDIDTQLIKGRDFFSERLGVDRFLGYFQSNSNTYGSRMELRADYRRVLEKEFICGLVISTRPDNIDGEIVDIIERLSVEFDKEVWIELGLQSSDDKTLKLIQRNHTYSDFVNAAALIKKGGIIKLGVHMIIGLPGEGPDDILLSNKRLFADSVIDGVKYRLLDIVEGTGIYELYQTDPELFYKFDDVTFTSLICDIIEIVPPETVIMRFANFKSLENVNTSENRVTKGTIIRQVEMELLRRGTIQGCRYKK